MLFEKDNFFMNEAYQLARQAATLGEIPVGAVITWEGQIIARAYNQSVMLNDATAHAEMIAITSAYAHVGSRYLNECTLYVTLEPCVMCAGACYWSMFKRVVYAAGDSKYGYTKTGSRIFHPSTEVVQGVMAEECSELIKQFFKNLRR